MPIFIVFEGIDGAGKTSVIAKTKEFLEGAGHCVTVTREPTDGDIGKFVEMNDSLSPEAEALLFTADRACHTDMIRKWMSEGRSVISDRYYASTLAYQSASGMDIGWLSSINSKVITEPNMTILLDLDPEISLERVGKRGEKSRFEKLGYLRKVRSAYLDVAKEKGFIVIDASGTEDEVRNAVIEAIKGRMYDAPGRRDLL